MMRLTPCLCAQLLQVLLAALGAFGTAAAPKAQLKASKGTLHCFETLHVAR